MFKMVDPEVYALGQRAVAALGWKWVVGMLSIEPMRDKNEEDDVGEAGDEAGGDAWRLHRIDPDGTLWWMTWCFVMPVTPSECAVLPDLSDERTLSLAREVAGLPGDADAKAVVVALEAVTR